MCLRARWASAARSVGEVINFVSLLPPLPSSLFALVLCVKLLKPRAMGEREYGLTSLFFRTPASALRPLPLPREDRSRCGQNKSSMDGRRLRDPRSRNSNLGAIFYCHSDASFSPIFPLLEPYLAPLFLSVFRLVTPRLRKAFSSTVSSRFEIRYVFLGAKYLDYCSL